MTVKRFGFVALAFQAPLASAQTVQPQPAVASQHQRLLPLQGGQNFRDLGGYRTSDGHTVR